jgi:hypothetical protein
VLKVGGLWMVMRLIAGIKKNWAVIVPIIFTLCGAAYTYHVDQTANTFNQEAERLNKASEARDAALAHMVINTTIAQKKNSKHIQVAGFKIEVQHRLS